MDVISVLRDTLNKDITENEKKNIEFYIHYLKTIQKKYRKKWLLKRCETVERLEGSEKPISIMYKGITYSFPTYCHACYYVMRKEIDNGLIKF